MSHLICEKCGGRYKLKKDESPDDFTSCECGGNLKYIQNFNMHFDDELDPINELTICPNCGADVFSSEKYCKFCGNITENNKKTSSNVEKGFENKKIIISLIGIIIGILIVIIPHLIIINQNYAFLLLVIGGLVASLIAGKNNEERVLIGIIVGLVSSIILMIFKSNIIISSETSYLFGFIFEMAGPILILTLFGLIGGLIDISVRYLFSRFK